MATIGEHVEQKKSNRHLIMLAVAALAAGLLVGWLLWQWVRPYSYHGLEVQASTPVTNFTLTGPGGQPTSLVDFRDKIVVLYFGYTFCPDVCPATMSELKTAMAELGRQSEDVQVIMVSLDPERDTPEKLAEYMAYFHPSFIGLTGSEDEIIAASAPLGIFYQRHEGTAASGYLIDHTATAMVLDRHGRLRLVLPFGASGEEIATDLRHLLRE
jgi:protein SCO1/2